MSNLDEIKIGGLTADFEKLVEMQVQAEAELSETESNLPLDQKLISKNWKLRSDALSELELIIQDGGDVSSIISSVFQLIRDNHAACLEKALEVVSLILLSSDENKDLVSLAKAIVEHAFCFTKQNVKNKAKELFLIIFKVAKNTIEIQNSVVLLVSQAKLPKVSY